MRMDRLLNIVALLANRRQMKAQELAEHFGVSVRTIYRDADTISLAGFPIVSYPGAGGGLGIAEGFRLDRTVLSEEELSSVMLALHSTSGLWPDDTGSAALEKLRAVLAGACTAEAGQARLLEGMDSLRFDYAPWSRPEGYSAELKLLRQGIDTRTLVRFQYFGAGGESAERLVEPHTLVMKSGQWYLYAYCLLRQDFRLFRLSRVRRLELAEEQFLRREQDQEQLPWNKEWQTEGPHVEVKLRLPRRLQPLAEEWFGWGQAAEASGDGEGDLVLMVRMPEDDRLIGYLLSFGELVEVLEPEHLRRRLRETALAVAARYSGITRS